MDTSDVLQSITVYTITDGSVRTTKTGGSIAVSAVNYSPSYGGPELCITIADQIFEAHDLREAADFFNSLANALEAN